MAWLEWLLGRLPTWSRFAVDARLAEQRCEFEKRERAIRLAHGDELNRITSQVGEVMTRCANVRIRALNENKDRYVLQVQMDIDPVLMAFGRHDVDQQRMIAREVGRRIEREIATSRFVTRWHTADGLAILGEDP